MKKFVCLFLIGFLCIQVGVGFGATDYTDSAKVLNALNLFSGTDAGYELERAPKRVEGAVMLVRLLGKEEEAVAANHSHPFLDVPKWADPHIGFMYHEGLTKGVSENRFDSDSTLNGNAYATFVLRALGYDDSIGDFKWNEAMNFSVEKGLIDSKELALMSKKFTRNEMVGLSHAALKAYVKNQNQTLIERLVDSGAVQKEAASKHFIMGGGVSYPVKVIVGDKMPSEDARFNYHKMTIDLSEFPKEAQNAVAFSASGYYETPKNVYELFMKFESIAASSSRKPSHAKNFENNSAYVNYYNHNILTLYGKDDRRIGVILFQADGIGVQEGTFYLMPDQKNPIAMPKDFFEIYQMPLIIESPSGLTIVSDKDIGTYEYFGAILDLSKAPAALKNVKYMAIDTRVAASDVREAYSYTKYKQLSNPRDTSHKGLVYSPINRLYKSGHFIQVIYYDAGGKEIARSIHDFSEIVYNQSHLRYLTAHVVKGNRVEIKDFYVEQYVEGIKNEAFEQRFPYGAHTSEGADGLLYVGPFWFKDGIDYKLIARSDFLTVNELAPNRD